MRSRPASFQYGFYFLLIFTSTAIPFKVFCQDSSYYLNIWPDKLIICKGDIATLTIELFTTSGGQLSNIQTEDIYYKYANCEYLGCTATNVDPTVDQEVVSKEVTVRKGCNTDPTVQSKIEIKVKPDKTTTYTVSWSVKTTISADPCAGRPDDFVGVGSFKGSITIYVAQPDPPTLTPGSQTVNQFSQTFIHAFADFLPVSIYGQKIIWHQTVCGVDKILDSTYYYDNPTDRITYPSELDTLQFRAQKVDNGCRSDLSDPVSVVVKPCRLFSSGCNQTDVDIVEGLSCDPSVQEQIDHHFYSFENTICSGGDCSLDDIWQFYKSEQNHQIPIQADQLTVLKYNVGNNNLDNIFLSRALFPEQDFGGPLEDCQSENIASPFSFAIELGLHSENNDVVHNFNLIKSALPGLYSDPVFLRIDETDKCIVNYTGEGHLLYPGKVTRCLVKECDKVKIKTFGEGTTEFADNPLGHVLSKLNYYGGTSIFQHVDERLIQEYDESHKSLVQKSQTIKSVSVDANSLNKLEGKNWNISSFQVQYNEGDSLTPVFTIQDTTNFWNLKAVNVDFLEGNEYKVSDVFGGSQTGTWNLDSVNNIVRLDTTNYSLVSLDSNTLVVKGITTVSKDSSFTTANYYMTLINTATNNSWIGIVSSVWENADNWSGGFVPDEYTDVIINPNTPYSPILSSNTSIKSLTLKTSGALEVKNGFRLNIVGINKSK